MQTETKQWPRKIRKSLWLEEIRVFQLLPEKFITVILLRWKFNACYGDRNSTSICNSFMFCLCLKIGSLKVECLFTPCHTSGHICYHVTGDEGHPGAVFTGDTLFLAGCGRFFEGTPKEMHAALIEILSELPPETVRAKTIWILFY